MFATTAARRRSALAALICAVLAVAGCGSSTKTVVVYTGTTSTSPASTATNTQTTATNTQTTATSPAETKTSTGASEAPVAVVRESTFQSPSGNIGCIIIGGLARCDIRNRSWSPPPHPASCSNEVDFGQGLEVGQSGPGRLVCAGDTTLDPAAPKLAYGNAAESEGFVCVSRTLACGE